MFYNEHFKINANDLSIHFPYDGSCRYNNEIYYYVSFNEKHRKEIVSQLRNKGYRVIFVDDKFKLVNNFPLLTEIRTTVTSPILDNKQTTDTTNTINTIDDESDKTFIEIVNSVDSQMEYKQLVQHTFTKSSSSVMSDDFVLI